MVGCSIRTRSHSCRWVRPSFRKGRVFQQVLGMPAEVQKLRADSGDDGPCYQDLGVEAACIGPAGDHRDEV